VQYNTARTLRHLALGSQPAHKTAALPAVIPLTQALQVTFYTNAPSLHLLSSSCIAQSHTPTSIARSMSEVGIRRVPDYSL